MLHPIYIVLIYWGLILITQNCIIEKLLDSVGLETKIPTSVRKT